MAAFAVYNNALYFNSYSDTLGDTLFTLAAGSTTPTPVDPTGTVLSHTFGDDSAFHVFDGNLYFDELRPALGGDTLFKLDTSGTPTPLTFNNGTTDEALQGAGEFGGFTDFSGSAYFVATTLGEGTQLFKLNAAGAITEVTNIAGGAFDINLVSGFAQYAGSLYFDAIIGGRRQPVQTRRKWDANSDRAWHSERRRRQSAISRSSTAISISSPITRPSYTHSSSRSMTARLTGSPSRLTTSISAKTQTASPVPPPYSASGRRALSRERASLPIVARSRSKTSPRSAIASSLDRERSDP